MPIGIGLIISGLISAGTTLAAGGLSNKARREAGEEQLGLANIAREDTLKQRRIETGLAKENIGLSKKKFGYEKMMNRELSNKQSIANLGNSLNMLTKNGMDMNAFISSLYGNSVARMAQ